MYDSSPTNLPVDILENILCSLPSFSALHASILSCKAFYNIYRHHPCATMRAVAENMAGVSSLPATLTLAVWINFKEENHNALPTNGRAVQQNYGSELLTDTLPNNRLITWQEAKTLAFYADYAQVYEQLFSKTFKNSRVQHSVLSNEESDRFRAALARIWLYYAVPSGVPGPINNQILINQDGDDEDDDDEHNSDGGWVGEPFDVEPDDAPGVVAVDVDDPLEEQAAEALPFFNGAELLSRLGTRELLDMEQVHIFMDNVRINAANRNLGRPLLHWEDPALGDLLSMGPKWLWDRYESRHPLTWVPDYRLVYANQVKATAALSRLLEEKKVKRHDWSLQNTIQGLLKSAVGIDDACDHCHEVKGLDLRSLDCLNDISCIHTLQNLMKKLPSNLSANSSEALTFNQFIDTNREMTTEIVFEEVFDLNLTELDNWKRDDRLCVECLDNILKASVYDWWVATKQTMPGYQEKQDCWYGIDCRTQTHRPHHAQRLNHMCKFTGKPTLNRIANGAGGDTDQDAD